jgi:hypothetical protein
VFVMLCWFVGACWSRSPTEASWIEAKRCLRQNEGRFVAGQFAPRESDGRSTHGHEGWLPNEETSLWFAVFSSEEAFNEVRFAAVEDEGKECTISPKCPTPRGAIPSPAAEAKNPLLQ